MTRSDPFSLILQHRLNRRGFLYGASALAASTALPVSAMSGTDSSPIQRLSFTEITRGRDAHHHVAKGYDAQVLIRWGDAVMLEAPTFDPHTQTAKTQAKQFGFNNDFTAYFPIKHGTENSSHGLLCVNHEYPNSHLMFPGITKKQALDEPNDDQQRINQQAVGVSVVEVKQIGGEWHVVTSDNNRRITATTPMNIAGPAAGHARMKTSTDPTGKHMRGTFANCAGGMTPWGTYLTCEENFDGFFTLPDDVTDQREHHMRYGIGKNRFHRMG